MIHHLINTPNIILLSVMTFFYIVKLVCQNNVNLYLPSFVFVYIAAAGIITHLLCSTSLSEGALISKLTFDNILFVGIAAFIFHFASVISENVIHNSRNALTIENLKERDMIFSKIHQIEISIQKLNEDNIRHYENIEYLTISLQKLSDKTASMFEKMYKNGLNKE